MIHRKFFVLYCILVLTSCLNAQKIKKFDLVDLQLHGKLKVINRTVETIEEQDKKFVKVSEDHKEGVLWLSVDKFENGVIEIEMRGKDVLQRSFIGLIFHGQNDSTFDAVYCRPFNFFATDSVRRIHAIQYISHPDFPWQKLRENRNAIFEKEILLPADPNDWFTMKLKIENKSVMAYINQAKQPSLVIEKLSNTKTGKLGIFVGDGNGGDFRSVLTKRGLD